MEKVKELLSELRDVTERSRPNIMANDQINLIEAIEFELNKNDEPNKPDEALIDNVKLESETSSQTMVLTNDEATIKKGRKSK